MDIAFFFFFFCIDHTAGTRPLGSLVTPSALCNVTCDLLFFLESPLCGFSLESLKKMFLSLETEIEKAPLTWHTTLSTVRANCWAMRVGRVDVGVTIMDSVTGTHWSNHSALSSQYCHRSRCPTYGKSWISYLFSRIHFYGLEIVDSEQRYKCRALWLLFLMY